MNRRAAIARARELLRRKISAPRSSYEIGDRCFTIRNGNNEFVVRLAKEWRSPEERSGGEAV